jgi:hypothetical protein
MTTYDLHFQLLDPAEIASGTGGKLFTFGFRRPIGISGPQKLFNRWVKTLLESQGSYPLRRTRGTGFGTLIGSNIEQMADMEATVHLYIDAANEQVKAADRQSRWLTDDERLSDGHVRTFNVVPPDGFDVTVELITISGKRLVSLLPSSIFMGDTDG